MPSPNLTLIQFIVNCTHGTSFFQKMHLKTSAKCQSFCSGPQWIKITGKISFQYPYVFSFNTSNKPQVNYSSPLRISHYKSKTFDTYIFIINTEAFVQKTHPGVFLLLFLMIDQHSWVWLGRIITCTNSNQFLWCLMVSKGLMSLHCKKPVAGKYYTVCVASARDSLCS